MNCFENFSEKYSAALTTRSLGRDLLLFDELDSTNAWCKRRIAAGDAPAGLAAAALRQTAGRGRLGRSWESGAGLGLYVSFAAPALPGALLPLVPLAAGIAVSEAAEQEAGRPVGIKWPNDIILEGKKLCGILCEGAGDRAVCGIGVNLLQDAAFFSAASLPHAVSLLTVTGRVPDAAALAAGIANRLEPLLDALLREGAASLVPALEKRCVSLGREVRAVSAAGTLTGVAVGIDEEGRLVIETGHGRHAVSAGEVQLRTAEGYL